MLYNYIMFNIVFNVIEQELNSSYTFEEKINLLLAREIIKSNID